MHEFHRHHRSGTLRADLVKRADGLMSAAKLFRQEVGRYADQRMQVGQSGAAFQDSVDNALELLKDLTDVARRWDYDRCAADVISWMNERACANRTVFRSLESLEARGAARYTQDVPPGFLDRIKQDSPDKGSNKYGDLLFWQEVVEDAQKKGARAVIIVTRDRKEDWFAGEPDPNLTLDWQRVRAKWRPVPRPHPTLAFELKVEAQAQLELLDELYLGAVLWKFGRPTFERLASAAIAVTPEQFERVDPPPAPVRSRAHKRRDQPGIGLVEANSLIDSAVEESGERVTAFLGMLEGDAPDVDKFLDELEPTALAQFDKRELANLALRLHDGARQGLSPAVRCAHKVIGLLDALPAHSAAAIYIGFLSSTYLVGGRPLDRPDSPFMEDLFAWQTDTAFQVILRAFALRMGKLRSTALYLPNSRDERRTLRVEHDAQQQQDPVALIQVYLGTQALLTDGETRPDAQLRVLVGHAASSVRDIARALARHYGLPFGLLDITGGAPDELRFIPDHCGLREFSRFDQQDGVDALSAGPDAVKDALPIEADESDEDEPEENEPDEDWDASLEED
ncbi:hypothetical protein IL54_1739 [Sphingobium sp. ba1]|nr:hypothetical protein IL54_1739 [Sphingobium sp. ba1]